MTQLLKTLGRLTNFGEDILTLVMFISEIGTGTLALYSISCGRLRLVGSEE